MNLPATAIEFLSCYRGLYAGQEALFTPYTDTQLPMVHVHCFALRSDDDVPRIEIAQRVSRELGVTMQWDGGKKSDAGEGRVTVDYVRNVAPAKNMYCASFRLPAEVAFAPRD